MFSGLLKVGFVFFFFFVFVKKNKTVLKPLITILLALQSRISGFSKYFKKNFSFEYSEIVASLPENGL